MEPPLGLVHWHAALTILTPGLFLVATQVGLLILPRGRALVAVAAGVVALALSVLVMRTMWIYGAHWAMLPGGWVHAGTVGVGVAATVAMWVGCRQPPRDGQACLRSGAAYLMVLWSMPLAALAALDDAGRWRPLLALGVLAGAVVAWFTVPAWGQALAMATVAAVAPRWRLPAMVAFALAVLASLIPEAVP